MAIDDLTTPQAAAPQPIDIEAWTEQATAAIGSVTISSAPVVQGTSVAFDIPLDDLNAPASTTRPAPGTTPQVHTVYKRREPIRRDSLKRREALLKGKEGSRRRQRWENDRLLNNPHAEPPAPHDWEVHPTHLSRNVPYYLAPLWDAGLKRQSTKRHDAAVATKNASRTVATHPTTPGVVPKELREKLKRSRGAKGLLMDLESSVRAFVAEWDAASRAAADDGLPSDPDSEDEEIVFVGRNGVTTSDSDSDARPRRRELMLFETPEDDNGGCFGRWLVHHIGVYYGLTTWSVTVGEPARREAYIGIRESMRSGVPKVCSPMPTPLWGMV